MSSKNLHSSIINTSQLFSKYSNLSQQSFSTTTNKNIIEDNNKLFEFILEIAINNDLDLPSKNKDFTCLLNNDINLQNNYFELNSINKIDKNKTEEIMKILAKYSN